jgi:CheY-like chemotaxis protein/LmbE family N-acetylglucosaminyl deacetylase
VADCVLVVDDDEVLREIVTRSLRSAGFVVTEAADAEQALEAIAGARWDAVVTDVQMPGMDGLELLRRINDAPLAPPVVVITGSGRMEHAIDALRAKAAEFLQKPFRPDELVDATHRVIAESRARRTNDRVLAIGAHPDDVEIGCAGALARHRSIGDELTILTLSHGAEGGDRALRVGESQRAADALGATLLFGDLPDTAIGDGLETITLIRDAIATSGATTIYTHSVHERHQDHRNAARATAVAARGVGEILAYEGPSTTVEFRPNRFVDISTHLDAKLAAVAAFESQRAIRAYLADDVIVGTARYWSRSLIGTYVEAFEVVSSVG